MRANIESKILNRITVGFNLAPSATWSEGGRVDGKDQQANNMLTMCPIVEPTSGLYTGAEGHPPYAWTSSSKVSPIANMEQTVRDSENARFSTSAYVKADIWNGVWAELTGSNLVILHPNGVTEKVMKQPVAVQTIEAISSCYKHY